MADSVFRRERTRPYPVAVGGDGATIWTEDGARYLDATSGVFVTCLGYNPEGVAERIAERMKRLQFAYAGEFASEDGDRMARLLVERAPPGLTKVWLTTSGATANEAAMKLARQYHLLRGEAEKTVVISRWHSYHGSTIGALSLSGSTPRRRPYQPYLLDIPHVMPPNPYRLASGSQAEADLAALNDIECTIRRLGARYVSAIIIEPVAGAPLGALVSSPDYLAGVREICDRHNLLMIADEIVSGMGRTGTWFALGASRVVPDILTLAKGLGAGFMPAGAIIAHEHIHDVFAKAGSDFVHGESFNGHPGMAAAACATMDFIEERNLLHQVSALGRRLSSKLLTLRDHPLVGDVRGKGLLQGVELVCDKALRKPFSRDLRVAEQVIAAARRNGVLLLAGTAGADGADGDTIVLAPAYVTTEPEIDVMVDALAAALDEVLVGASV